MQFSVSLSDVSFVVITDTLFNGRIQGGALPLGPKGIIAVKNEHVPEWMRHHFDQGTIDADSSHDLEVKQLLTLIEEGHAVMIPSMNTFNLHVNAKVTPAFLSSSSESSAASRDDSVAAMRCTPQATDNPDECSASPAKKARV